LHPILLTSVLGGRIFPPIPLDQQDLAFILLVPFRFPRLGPLIHHAHRDGFGLGDYCSISYFDKDLSLSHPDGVPSRFIACFLDSNEFFLLRSSFWQLIGSTVVDLPVLYALQVFGLVYFFLLTLPSFGLSFRPFPPFSAFPFVFVPS